jgi:hypothetical protein
VIWTTVADLAGLGHCKALVLLKAYFDESGTHRNPGVTCIAGYVGTVDEWAPVETRWQELLAPYAQHGLTYWHQTDYRARDGQFAGIEPELSDIIFNALVRVIRDSELQVIWNGIDADAFDRVVPPQFARAGREFKPYELCFYWIIRQLDRWRLQRGYQESDRIAMVFAVQDEYNDRSDMTLKSWQRAGLMQEFLPLMFDFPKHVPALQPADILVNEMYRSWLQVKRGTTQDRFVLSDILRDMASNGLEEGGFATEAALRDVVANPEAWTYPGLRGAK